MYTLYKGPQYTLLPIFKALSIILLFHMVKDNSIFFFHNIVFFLPITFFDAGSLARDPLPELAYCITKKQGRSACQYRCLMQT